MSQIVNGMSLQAFQLSDLQQCRTNKCPDKGRYLQGCRLQKAHKLISDTEFEFAHNRLHQDCGNGSVR